MSGITKTVAIAIVLSFSALAGAHAETAAPFRNGGSPLNVNPFPYQSFGRGSPQPQGVHSTASFGGAALGPIQPTGIPPISSPVFGGTPLRPVQPIRSISPVSSGPVQTAPVTLPVGIYPRRLPSLLSP